MQDEYELKSGTRGAFFRPDSDRRFVISYDHRPEHGRFDLVAADGGCRYTLRDERGSILMRSEVFASEEEALAAIEHLRETVVGAETVISA